MSNLINSELLNYDPQKVETPMGEVGTDDAEVNRISREIHFDWQPTKRLTGRERYLALCKKLGLKPKEPRP